MYRPDTLSQTREIDSVTPNGGMTFFVPVERLHWQRPVIGATCVDTLGT